MVSLRSAHRARSVLCPHLLCVAAPAFGEKTLRHGGTLSVGAVGSKARIWPSRMPPRATRRWASCGCPIGHPGPPLCHWTTTSSARAAAPAQTECSGSRAAPPMKAGVRDPNYHGYTDTRCPVTHTRPSFSPKVGSTGILLPALCRRSYRRPLLFRQSVDFNTALLSDVVRPCGTPPRARHQQVDGLI